MYYFFLGVYVCVCLFFACFLPPSLFFLSHVTPFLLLPFATLCSCILILSLCLYISLFPIVCFLSYSYSYTTALPQGLCVSVCVFVCTGVYKTTFSFIITSLSLCECLCVCV
jgi:hypothetical protein